MPTPALPPLPDSEIAVAALRFVDSRVPEFVSHHCVRGYIYGRELAGQRGLRAGRDYDDELLFLANVLHDLGVSTVEESSERFEVHGADQAVAFARSAGLATGKLPVLWDAVALHTSAGTASRKQPEVALAQLGISADIVGVAREQLPADLVAAVHERYPRRDLGYALTELIVDQARRNPAKAVPLTFPGHLLDLHGSVSTARTWFDVLSDAGWGDRPVTGFAAEGAESPEQLAGEFTSRLARRDLDGLVALYDPGAVFGPAPPPGRGPGPPPGRGGGGPGRDPGRARRDGRRRCHRRSGAAGQPRHHRPGAPREQGDGATCRCGRGADGADDRGVPAPGRRPVVLPGR